MSTSRLTRRVPFNARGNRSARPRINEPSSGISESFTQFSFFWLLPFGKDTAHFAVSTRSLTDWPINPALKLSPSQRCREYSIVTTTTITTTTTSNGGPHRSMEHRNHYSCIVVGMEAPGSSHRASDRATTMGSSLVWLSTLVVVSSWSAPRALRDSRGLSLSN